MVYCTQATEDAEPGILTRINRQIMEARQWYVADITVAFQLIEIHFPPQCCSSNGHTAVCRATNEMPMMGAILPELGFERTVCPCVCLPTLPACLPYLHACPASAEGGNLRVAPTGGYSHPNTRNYGLTMQFVCYRLGSRWRK